MLQCAVSANICVQMCTLDGLRARDNLWVVSIWQCVCACVCVRMACVCVCVRVCVPCVCACMRVRVCVGGWTDPMFATICARILPISCYSVQLPGIKQGHHSTTSERLPSHESSNELTGPRTHWPGNP